MNLKEIEFYGDKPYLAVKHFKIPNYYGKKDIEGDSQSVLREGISVNGVKKPIVINTYPGREGIIIDGVEVYKIGKEIGIYDLPIYELYVSETIEKEYHFLFSLKAKEYSVEEIIAQLKAPYYSYFENVQVNELHQDVFSKGEAELANSLKEVQNRKHSFLLRFDEEHKEYLDKLQEFMGTQSKNEAIIKLIVNAVERSADLW